jgi:hypothetical protein
MKRRLISRTGSWLAAVLCLAGAIPAQGTEKAAQPSLEEVREARRKWIETQQLITKERNDWTQGKDLLLSRLELVKKEVATLEEGIRQAEATVAKTTGRHEQMLAENERLKASSTNLTTVVTGMEGRLRGLFPRMPEPVQTRLQPFQQRMPEDPAKTKASFPERFQNVLVLLGMMNGANNEITVTYEVKKLAGGRPAEVKVLYAGLAHAWYMSGNGEAGFGRPGPEGWQWQPMDALARDMRLCLEVLDGKHTPTFVPMPVRIQ